VFSTSLYDAPPSRLLREQRSIVGSPHAGVVAGLQAPPLFQRQAGVQRDWCAVPVGCDQLHVATSSTCTSLTYLRHPSVSELFAWPSVQQLARRDSSFPPRRKLFKKMTSRVLWVQACVKKALAGSRFSALANHVYSPNVGTLSWDLEVEGCVSSRHCPQVGLAKRAHYLEGRRAGGANTPLRLAAAAEHGHLDPRVVVHGERGVARARRRRRAGGSDGRPALAIQIQHVEVVELHGALSSAPQTQTPRLSLIRN
jgi:hypothetical protein